ncbi:hypothetical protein BDW59DRAFT_149085 [Aspergillus cavernicola]|uniref:BTB domain-containing protein n=1 Tax=Aspergillus cavernicola TaxID=176166 RepID=A0ABR4I638_9EURO
MDNFAEVIRSPEFHFLVGHDGRRLTIHAGLVQKLSRPLEALINNGCMKKSLSQTAVMDDVEEETFIAFCDFGYRGKYTTPCRKDKDSEDHLAAADQMQTKEFSTQSHNQNHRLNLRRTGKVAPARKTGKRRSHIIPHLHQNGLLW